MCVVNRRQNDVACLLTLILQLFSPKGVISYTSPTNISMRCVHHHSSLTIFF